MKNGKEKLVEVGQFCTMESSKFAEYGCKRGDLIYLAGDGLVPESEEDPYLYRKLFVAAFTKDEHLLPDDKPFLVNAKNIKPVSDVKQLMLETIMEEDFKGEDDGDDSGDAEGDGEENGTAEVVQAEQDSSGDSAEA